MYLKHCEVESRIEFFKGDIQEIIKSKKTIKKWAYILHDKDDTFPHYHIYLNFGTSGVDTKQVAEWFGLQESQVNKIRGRHTDMLLYLTHGNDSQKNKHQYSPTEVVANFDFETEITNAKILGDFENFSYAQQLEYVNSLPLSEKLPAYNKLDNSWRVYCKWLSLHNDRKIDVIFITGKGGTGKTYYAKKLLTDMKLDYCVSSSSNDIFQDYLGQKAIILDDLRDKAFINSNGTDNLEDLLKILDNNTASSVRSRFANKVFNGKVIVITSSVPIKFWFPRHKSSDMDGLEQLYRRISCYVEMGFDEITVYNDGVDEAGNPKGVGVKFKNELAGKKEKQVIRTDFTSVFANICDKVPLSEQMTMMNDDGKLPF